MLNAPEEDITPSTVNVLPFAASNSPAPAITIPRVDCSSTDWLAKSAPPLKLKPLALAPKFASALIESVPAFRYVPPV